MSTPADTARIDRVQVGASGPFQDYRVLLIAVSAIVVVIVAYWGTFSRMMAMWSIRDYQYAWLVYPLCLYILWRKRRALAHISTNASWIGVALTALLVLLWFIGRAVGVQVVEFASISLLILSLFWAVAGTRAVHVAGFPLALLLAAVPTGEFVVAYLQESTASIASALLHVAGVPAYREGNFLMLPGGSFEVAEACGGLRYLLAAGMGSLAYAYLSYSRIVKRVLFVIIASASMVVANGIRAFIVMVVASATEMHVFAGKDHIYFGMVLFAACFAGLIYVGDRYSDRDPPRADSLVPQVSELRSSLAVTVAVALCLGAGPGLLYLQKQQPAPTAITADFPSLAGCSGPGVWNRHWSPEFQNPDHLQRASYDCGKYAVAVYFASYSTQEQGKELAGSGNRVWPYEWRRYVRESVVALESRDGPRDVRQVYVHAPDRSMLIWYWYQVGRFTLKSDLGVKAALAATVLALDPVPASIVAVEVEVPGEVDPEELGRRLQPRAEALMAWYSDASGENRR